MFGWLKRYLPQNWSRGAQIGAAVGGATLAVIASPAVLGWGAGWTVLAALGGAALGAQAGVAIEKQYLLSVAKNKLGITPPPITIKLKKEAIDGEERIAFTFENVTAFDINEIHHAVTQYTGTTDIRQIENYKFDDIPKYRVRLVAKKDITLGELDFSDVSTFNIEVTTPDGHAVSEDEREKVLTTLNVMPKFLGGELTDPTATATDVIDEAGSAIGDWLKRNLFGRTNRITTAPAAAPNPQLETEKFFDSLIEVAIKTGRYEEILGHYRNTMIAQYKKNNALKQEEKRLTDHINNSLGFFTRPSIPVLVAALAVTAACIAIAFIPGANIALAATFAVIALGVALFQGFRLLSRFFENRRLARQNKEHEKKIAAFESKYDGLDVTNRAIEACIRSNAPLLSLENQKVTDACTRVISKWICSVTGQSCNELRLSKNNITALGASNIAEALKNSSTIQKIDLSNNPIEASGVEAIKEALLENFSITSFSYDRETISEELSSAITKQLLINKFLQGQPVTEKELKQYFGNNIQNLHIAAINKIMSAKNFSCLQIVRGDELPNDINRALRKKQLQLIFAGNLPKDQQLTNYIQIYNEVSTEDLEQARVSQVAVLELIKNAVFKNKTKEPSVRSKSASELKTLVEMTNADRTNLLARCLADVTAHNIDPTSIDIHKHARGLAALASQLIGFDKAFTNKELRTYIEEISTWGTAPATEDEDLRFKFDILISSLAGFSERCEPTDAQKIDEIVQSTLQEDLVARFGCLRGINDDSFAQLKDELNLEHNCHLKKFNFPEGVAINAEVRSYIEDIIKRNELRRVLDSAPEPTPQTFTEFLRIYKTIRNPKCLAAPAIDKDAILDLVRTDTLDITKKNILYTKLRELGATHPQHLQSLLELCFHDEELNQEKAALISSIICSPDTFDPDTQAAKPPYRSALINAFPWPRSFFTTLLTFSFETTPLLYDALKNRLEGERIRALREEEYTEAAALDDILQSAYQMDLTSKYPCLSQKLKPLKPELSTLVTELGTNRDLRQFNFPTETQADPKVISYVQLICARNRMLDVVDEHERDNATSDDRLRDFMTACHNIKETEENYDLAFSAMNPVGILHTIADDIREDVSADNYTGLREFNTENHPAFIALLKRCFTPDSAEKAGKKAVLVAKLLEISALFDPANQENPFIKDIVKSIYWSMTPWTMVRAHTKAYYDFDTLEQKLRTTLDNPHRLGETANREQILNSIQQAIVAADTLTLQQTQIDLQHVETLSETHAAAHLVDPTDRRT